MLLVRNVGHHMRLDAVRTADGEPLLEEVLDALVSATAALHDLRGRAKYSHTRAGSVYIVKPKMHGPDEVSLSVELLAAVEEALGLEPHDAQDRHHGRGEADVGQPRGVHRPRGGPGHLRQHRVPGPHRRRDPHRLRGRPGGAQGRPAVATWLTTYEDRNVDVALRAGFAGQAQVGKGMWAKPAAMREMLDTKGAHPRSGASTAWVPSPTAATLHALHYLETDVLAVQQEVAKRPLADRRGLLVPPVLADRRLRCPTTPSATSSRRARSRSWATSCAGSGLGIGCSTVPDLQGVGLMEDRATLRISSQQIANWLHHGLVDEAQVRETFARMAALVDEQNAGEPGYPPMSADLEASPSFQAALDLVFSGRREPNGYTERALTVWRQRAKGDGAAQEEQARDAVLADQAPAPSP